MSLPSEETFYYQSPVGWIRICSQSGGITSLHFKDPEGEIQPPTKIAADCSTELDLYFIGKLQTFSLALVPVGTAFQLKVWNELVKIPYGQVITYRDLAIRMGGPTYTRIVGQSNGKNPISILIPCHRVVGMNGSLTGYAGGLWRKKFLLELEQKGDCPNFNPSLF